LNFIFVADLNLLFTTLIKTALKMASSIEKIIKQNSILVKLQTECMLEIEKAKTKTSTKTKTKIKISFLVDKMSKIIKKQRRILVKLVEKCSSDIEKAKKKTNTKTKVNKFKNMLDKLITAMDEYETKYNDLIALEPAILLRE